VIILVALRPDAIFGSLKKLSKAKA